MEKCDRVRLLKLRDELLDNVVLDVVTPALLQYELLSTEDYEKICQLSTNREKVTTFLDLVPTKGPDAFDKLVSALKDDYDWISAELSDVQVNQSDLDSYFPAFSTSSPNTGKLTVGTVATKCCETQERNQDTASYTSNEHSVKSVENSEISIEHSVQHILARSASSNGSMSPRQVSEFSPDFSVTGSDVRRSGDDVTTGSEALLRRKRELDNAEITEEMIEFVSGNPRIMRRWQSLAHQAGMSARVPVIQARIRMEGRDHDEHVVELIKDWTEKHPGEATASGLVKLLRSQKFNDTAEKIEDGSFLKKMRMN